jgi:hypothetical protein
MSITTNSTHAARSLPATLLHLEALVVLIGAITLYIHSGGQLLMFVVLLFVPDIFMVGYVKNNQLGSLVYNFGHTYLTPASVLVLALVLNATLGIHIALIWFAHIGLDRTIGYGLKYATGFKDTHFSKV